MGCERHEAAGWSHRLDDAVGDRLAGGALAGVEADLHPFELGEHVVRKVERPIRQDVALAPAQDPERRQQLVRGGDLHGLPAEVVGIEPRDDADVARVVADRQVLVAERLRGAAHLLDGRLAVGGGRMDVEVAADVAELEQVGGRRRRIELAQLGRRQRLGRVVAVRSDPLRRADRTDEVAIPALRCRPDHLDRVAVRGDADDPVLVALQHGDELRQVFGVREPLLRDDDGEAGRELAAAPRVAGRLAAECCRHLAHEGERAVQGHPAPRPRGR